VSVVELARRLTLSFGERAGVVERSRAAAFVRALGSACVETTTAAKLTLAASDTKRSGFTAPGMDPQTAADENRSRP